MDEVKHKLIKVACMCATDKKNESCCIAMVFENNRLKSKHRWKTKNHNYDFNSCDSQGNILTLEHRLTAWKSSKTSKSKHIKWWGKWTTTSLLWWWHTAGIRSKFLPKYCKCQFLFLLEYCKGLAIGFHWTLLLIVLEAMIILIGSNW